MSDSAVTINVKNDDAAAKAASEETTVSVVALATRVGLVEEKLTQNTIKLDRNNEMTAEIHAAWLPIKDALETLAKVGRFFAWAYRFLYRTLKLVAFVAGSLTAIWIAVYTYMHGLPPK